MRSLRGSVRVCSSTCRITTRALECAIPRRAVGRFPSPRVSRSCIRCGCCTTRSGCRTTCSTDRNLLDLTALRWREGSASPDLLRSGVGRDLLWGRAPALSRAAAMSGATSGWGRRLAVEGRLAVAGQKVPVRGGPDHCCDVACCGSGFFVTGGVGGYGRSGGADLATVVAYVRGPETVGSWGIHHRQGA